MASRHSHSTHMSLLEGLNHPFLRDSAWNTFLERYNRLIIHWCRKWGVDLTDADLMTYSDVNKLVQDDLGVRIQTIHFSPGPAMPGQSPLKRLAAASGGAYRHIDVNKFGGR